MGFTSLDGLDKCERPALTEPGAVLFCSKELASALMDDVQVLSLFLSGEGSKEVTRSRALAAVSSAQSATAAAHRALRTTFAQGDRSRRRAPFERSDPGRSPLGPSRPPFYLFVL